VREQRTVIIADDQKSLRLLLRATLGALGCRLLEVSNGADALDLSRREHPSLLLLDVGMPGMDGYTVCRTLKSDPETAGIPVVMLSARAQQSERQQGLDAGADAYLTKPFNPTDLRAMLKSMLG
jgi:CheY-like chemotaxis protein